MTLLFKIMFHCARYGRRVREQVLAFGINKDIDRRSLTCIDNNVEADTHIPDEGLLLYPVAVRAPTGHKEGSSRDDVSLLSSLLSHPIAPNTILSLPVCFHITKKTNLRSIWRQGLISRRSWRRSSDVHVLQPVCAMGSQIMDHHEER